MNVFAANALIVQTYQQVFERFPDSDGLLHYTTALIHGQMSETDFIKDVLGSAEAKQQQGPKEPLAFPQKIFFVAFESAQATLRSLWVTDGTSAGTIVLKTLPSGEPTNLVSSGSRIFFTAGGPPQSAQLWTSDGTVSGTVLLKDFGKRVDIYPQDLTIAGGRLFFGVDDGSVGAKLWTSDGTISGTKQVPKANTPGEWAVFPGSLTAVGGNKFFFAAFTDSQGRELWTCDAITGTQLRLVKDINAGWASSTPSNFVAVGDKLFFTATTATSGNELWSSDGTLAGTVMISDLIPGSRGGAPLKLTLL
jgi:ELWxxDGT repeat protein